MRHVLAHVLSFSPTFPLPALFFLAIQPVYHRTVWRTELGEGLHLPQGQVLGGGKHRREGVPET